MQEKVRRVSVPGEDRRQTNAVGRDAHIAPRRTILVLRTIPGEYALSDHTVIPSLSRDLGSAAIENTLPHTNFSAKILRLRAAALRSG